MASSCRISHFGMNPDSGGRPPRERRARAAVVAIMGVFDQLVDSVLIFVVCISLNVMNIADVMIMYIISARMVS